MKNNIIKSFMGLAGAMLASVCVGGAFENHLVLQSGGIGPFVVSGAPSPHTIDPTNTGFVSISLCDANCGNCGCDPQINRGTFTLTSGETYYFSAPALVAIAAHCINSYQSVRVTWQDTHVSDLCMNIACTPTSCTYSGAPGSVVLS